METNYQSGDIVLIRGTSFRSKLIRFLSRFGGDSRIHINHVGVVVVSGTTEYAEIVEVRLKPRIKRLREYRNSKNLIAVYRPRLPVEVRWLAGGDTDRFVTYKYGLFARISHFGDWCLGGRYFFRRLMLQKRYPISSWVVSYAYDKADFNFGVPPEITSPDDIWGYALFHPELFVTVKTLGELTN